jgi:MHS family proline/betaine transporter-like MFS transporter
MFMGLFFGALPLALTSLFPVSVRFSCISLSHNISMAIFGGTTPLAATILLDTTNNPNSPSLLLIIASSLSFLGVLSIKDTLESKKIISDQDIRAGRKA